MQIDVRLNDAEFMAGLVIAQGVRVMPTPPELARRLDELVIRRAAEDFPPPPLKEAVRQMLRKGGYKPAGRNKPASEYLAQAAREGRFPRINNLVDINNVLSLECGLPISLLDLDAVGPSAEIRYGRAGERYVFNAAGQEIDLEGLICVCRAGEAGETSSIPLGTPIKDSMRGKLKEHTTAVLGVVYGTIKALDPHALQDLLATFAALLQEHGGAGQVQQQVLAGGAGI